MQKLVTPAITATAKCFPNGNLAETAMSTIASEIGILRMILKLDQAKVPDNYHKLITPTSAAIGICSINGAANRINPNKALMRQKHQINDHDRRIYVDDRLTNHRTATHSTK